MRLDWVGTLGNAAEVISRLHRGEQRLVFTDSRRTVETLTLSLRERKVETFASHSSLAVDERRRSEQAFAEAQDTVIVATSTLELGIDVGDFDRCLQIGAPRTVASMLQRLGRTGRRVDTARNMLFLDTTEEEFRDHRPYYRRAVSRTGRRTSIRWPHRLATVRRNALSGRDGCVHRCPQFTALQGRTEIGLIDPMVLHSSHDGPLTITLAGRGWRVTSIDWNRKRAQVEPFSVGDKVRWSGVPQPISAALAGAIRRSLQGQNASGVVLKNRTQQRLSELRAEHVRVVGVGESDVLVPHDRGRSRWWTWAGGRENARTLAALTRVAPELLGEMPSWDNYAITVGDAATIPALRAALAEALERATDGENVFAPLIDERALREVKFGDMVPDEMLRAEVAGR